MTKYSQFRDRAAVKAADSAQNEAARIYQDIGRLGHLELDDVVTHPP